MSAVLAVRLDSDGDVLLTGPAIRALAATASRVDLLVSPAGRAAAELLPGVHEVLELAAPWTGFDPPPADAAVLSAAVAELRARRYDRAVVFTSFHQSPLPMAVLAKLAGIGWVGADCVDYPGSLLQLRHTRRGTDGPGGAAGATRSGAAGRTVGADAGATGPGRAGPGGEDRHEVDAAGDEHQIDPAGDRHEVDAALDLALASGGRLPDGDDGRLQVLRPPAPRLPGLPREPYVVVHPGASVPARAPRPADAARVVAALAAAGWAVVVTGGPAETDLTRSVTEAAGPAPAPAASTDGRASTDRDDSTDRCESTDRDGSERAAAAGQVVDLGGRTSFAELADVLAGAACVVVANTGPAHLAAAVATPVVSWFAPVVPASRWAPYGVPHVLLGDQGAPCRDSRARVCPVPGHPCLSGVPAVAVVEAVDRLTVGLGGGPTSGPTSHPGGRPAGLELVA